MAEEDQNGPGRNDDPEPAPSGFPIRYFENVLPVEIAALQTRRKMRIDTLRNSTPERSPEVRINPPRSVITPFDAQPNDESAPSVTHPVPPRLFSEDELKRAADHDVAVPGKLDHDKQRPQPRPCDAIGLALSGGGIRSAAVCLGAIQALHVRQRMPSFDYLSTVSGGGYIGAALSASYARRTGYPFGSGFRDNHAMAHLRNFSNYLLPRGHSRLRNGSEAVAILLRGILANALIILTLILFAALITQVLAQFTPIIPFQLTVLTGAVLSVVLISWAIARSLRPKKMRASDTHGAFLWWSRWLLILGVALAFAEFQPLAIHQVENWMDPRQHAVLAHHWSAIITGLGALATSFAALASKLDAFLKATERSGRTSVAVQRIALQGVILAAACIVPALVWFAYLLLTATLVSRCPFPDAILYGLWAAWAAGTAISALMDANSYSLNRFYRDRLAKAFLFALDHEEIDPSDQAAVNAKDEVTKIKLSELRNSIGPYPIINSSLNVQGSVEANKRGRDADFFIFTPDFVGSDLTCYARSGPRSDATGALPTTMEDVDSALDLGTAVAISGAAFSANMGSNTIRALTPTLALLNIRLGYWLRNPRYLAASSVLSRRFRTVWERFAGKFSLFREILNQLDETSPSVYLTDGGHIENLGIYELLKRGCQTIVAIDAEADPALAFPSLLKLERYARIDFGIRIELPWEQIGKSSADGGQAPHAAIGRILYPGGAEGLLIYLKSSVTGDEKDYILDYRKRNPSFPHETTLDQFFSEEQFEMYRALGFHIADGIFGTDRKPIAFRLREGNAFGTEEDAFAALDRAVPTWEAQPV